MIANFIKEDINNYLVEEGNLSDFKIINMRDYLQVEANVYVNDCWYHLSGVGQGTVSAFVNGFKSATILGYDFYDTHEMMIVDNGIKKVAIYVIIKDNEDNYQYATYIGDNAVVGLFECYIACVNKFVLNSTH